MIKNYKWKAIFSSLVILLPTLLGLFGEEHVKLPHGAHAMSVFLILPPVLLAIHWLCLLVTARDNAHNDQSPKVLGMIFFVCPVISLYASGIIWALMCGVSFNVYAILCLIMGIGFILIGNYMPKAKPNRTFGLRIKWTLASDENWTKTHRFSGRLWVITGAVALLGVFLPERIAPYFLIALLLAITVPPIVYSYRLYQKQLAGGLDPKKATVQKMPKWAIVLTAVLLGVIFGTCTVLSFTGSVESTCSDTALTVEVSYWKDLTVNYTDVESVEYRKTVEGKRVNGFGSPRLSVGWFRNDEFGNYTRYTYTQTAPCVVLTVDGATIVVNCADEAQTQALYNELIARIGG